MIGFVETLGAATTSFLVPAVIGLAVVMAASRLAGRRAAAAFALGLYFWFFTDTIGDASLLGLDQDSQAEPFICFRGSPSRWASCLSSPSIAGSSQVERTRPAA